MGTEPTTNDRSTEAGNGELLSISLPEFLNIFYRGRWIIVAVTVLGLIAGLLYGVVTKPLYLGSVQIRPGIVTYDDAGNPIRGWALKDVVQWYDSQRFWATMKHDEPFKDYESAPVIKAEFIPIGLQWTPGGNIITLSNLSRSPDECRLILQSAVESFNRQATDEGKDSDIELARGKATLRIESYRNDIALLTGLEERTQVDIKVREGELKILEAEVQRLGLQRDRFRGDKAWREKAIAATRDDLVSAQARLVQARHLLDLAVDSEEMDSAAAAGPGSDENPVTNILLSSARREQAGRVVQLLDTVGRLERTLFEGQVKIDTLAVRIQNIDLSLVDLDLKEAVDLAQRRERINNEIVRLKIELNRDIPHTRSQLENQIAAEEMRVSKLESVEQISTVQVSNGPVRPRKARAAAILTVLAFFASLGLVLVREYAMRNGKAITAR